MGWLRALLGLLPPGATGNIFFLKRSCGSSQEHGVSILLIMCSSMKAHPTVLVGLSLERRYFKQLAQSLAHVNGIHQLLLMELYLSSYATVR